MTENERDSAARDGNTDAGRASHVPTSEDREDERRRAVLFNDISRAPSSADWFRFSDRLALRDYLWAQGWRRDVRPEDVTG